MYRDNLVNGLSAPATKQSRDAGVHTVYWSNLPELLMMESAIGVLVSKFKVYAGSDGSADTLSRDEFRKLVKSELSNFVKDSADPAAVDRLMGSLDSNDDGELSFLEFWQLIGHLASAHGGFGQ